jgi:hypothetical protein
MCDDEVKVYLFYNKCTYPIGEYYIEIQMLMQPQISDILVTITEDLPHICSKSIRHPELNRDSPVHCLIFTLEIRLY